MSSPSCSISERSPSLLVQVSHYRLAPDVLVNHLCRLGQSFGHIITGLLPNAPHILAERSIARSADDRRSDIDLIVVGAISFGDIVNLLSTAEEKLGREVNAVVYPISEFKQKVREDHHFVRTVLEGEKIFLIGDESELQTLIKEIRQA